MKPPPLHCSALRIYNIAVLQPTYKNNNNNNQNTTCAKDNNYSRGPIQISITIHWSSTFYIM